MTCPCGLPETYEACCGRFHVGAQAPTAELMMRSRYCAFARRILPYLVRTSHPMHRHGLKPKDFQHSFGLGWRELEIIEVVAGGPDDATGMVHFKAHHRGGVLEERSRFVRVEGAWVYRDARG